MNNLLSINEVASLLYLAQQTSDVSVPVVQAVVGELFLGESHGHVHPINFGRHLAIDHHVGEFLFDVVHCSNQSLQSSDVDFGVVFFHDPKVVLNQLTNQLLLVVHVVFSLLQEWLTGFELVEIRLLNFLDFPVEHEIN
jgi:hypothetical protein